MNPLSTHAFSFDTSARPDSLRSVLSAAGALATVPDTKKMSRTSSAPRRVLSFSRIFSFMNCSSCIQLCVATVTNKMPLRNPLGCARRAINSPTSSAQKFQML